MNGDRHRAPWLLGRLVSPVVDAVDPDALLSRVDLDDLLERVDLDAALERIDLTRLLDRIDLNAVLQRIDVDALVARVNLDALLETVDVDRLVLRVNVDDVVRRVDVAAVVARVDVEGVVARVRVGDVVSDSATQIVTRSLDRARLTVARVDHAVLAVADRMAHRTALDDEATGMHYAGPFSRLGAWFLDSAFATASFSAAVAVGAYVAALFSVGDVDGTPGGSPWWVAAATAWLALYLFLTVFLAQRTPGMAVFGIRVARRDGADLRARQAFVRVAVLPVSFVLGIGFVGLVFGRRRRALHDIAARTVVLSDVVLLTPDASSRSGLTRA